MVVRYRLEVFILITLLTTLLCTIPPTLTGSITEKYVVLDVYRDGSVVVTQVVEIKEELPYIDIPLVAKPEKDTLVTYSGTLVLACELVSKDGRYFARVYAPSIGVLNVTYITLDLTSKGIEVPNEWTIRFSSKCDTVIVLPKGSILTSIPERFSAITSVSGRVMLVLPPGNYSISYVLEVLPEAMPAKPIKPKKAPPPEEVPPTKPTKPRPPIETTYLVLALVVVVIIAVITITLARRRVRVSSSTELMLSDVDRAIINYLRMRGGETTQSEIASTLGLPKSTVSRHIQKLRKYGIIEVKKVGKFNIIKLVR
ncbi:MAG: hypothetical protein DRJ40_01455 [Thermoprotei archaeon]|nr:MAG: hypothetical protein DRJ40_01455 [Thermoprotei archaeon]